MRAVRRTGQPGPVQGSEKPVSAAVTGEDPPGPVAAVCGRGQANHEDPGVTGAPAGNGSAPVRLGGVGRRFAVATSSRHATSRGTPGTPTPAPQARPGCPRSQPIGVRLGVLLPPASPRWPDHRAIPPRVRSGSPGSLGHGAGTVRQGPRNSTRDDGVHTLIPHV